MPLPSLRGIEAFMIAAEALSFQEAAERLNVTVSAISHRILALEDEIGFPLFDRGKRKVRLTVAGIKYYQRLVPVLSELKKTAIDIKRNEGEDRVRVASFQIFHVGWLSPRLPSFLKLWPDATVELVTTRKRDVPPSDITVQMLGARPDNAKYEKIFDYKVTPICRREVLNNIDLEASNPFSNVRLISIASSLDVWPRWLATAGLPLTNQYQYITADNPVLNLELACQAAGVGLAADFVVETYLKDGLVLPFDVACKEPGGVYINGAGKREKPVVAAFREWLWSEVEKTLAHTTSRPRTT